MHRKELLSLLKRYAPSCQEQALYKERILTFVQEEKRCFERSCLPGHITASCWLVSKENTHALLMHHKKIGIWCQLGGHADGESDPLQVALKEAKEESGIKEISPISKEIFDLDIYTLPETSNFPEHFHYDIRFLLQVTKEISPKKNHESHALTWVSKDTSSLPTSEESIIRMHAKWTKK